MRPIGDRSQPFILVLVISWVVLIALPLLASLQFGAFYGGLPALGVVLWFGLLRLARWLSPPVRADRLMRRGRYSEAVAWCDRALAVDGASAWQGRRRLIWLNRKVTAQLALARGAKALTTALEALTISADPQTISACASALLFLDRYDESERAARLALQLTRERSVSANATMAGVLLARGQPVEAEAHARAGLVDIEMLLPMVSPEHHVACLLSLSRALRLQGNVREGRKYLARLQRVARRRPALRAMVQIEHAEYLAQTMMQRGQAISLVQVAARTSPSYLRWYASQPEAFASLREEQGIVTLLANLEAQYPLTLPEGTLGWVRLAIEKAEHTARTRPAAQSSQSALTTQLVLLAGTAAILAVWAWHFYLAVSS